MVQILRGDSSKGVTRFKMSFKVSYIHMALNTSITHNNIINSKREKKLGKIGRLIQW